MNWFSCVEALRRDVHFGLRGLAHNRGFTAVAVLTLALGVGANTAIFSVVKAVLLDPLPYADVGRLVTISETSAAAPENPAIDYTTVRDLSAHSMSFESMSAYRDGLGIIHENDIPEMLRGLSVDQNFFDTLGVRMQLGRNFLSEEQQPNRRVALILSHGLWQRKFGADPHILGRIFQLGVDHVTVVGVLPPDFRPYLKATSDSDPEMYYPLAADGSTSCRNCQPVRLIGRLKPASTPAQASADLNARLQAMLQATPVAHPRGARLALVPLSDRLFGRTSTALWAVWCAAGLVLLIACANVANLLLARATGRAREIAVRAALGAKRGRIVRQLFTESLMLAIGGGLLGTGLAFFGVRMLASLAPARVLRAQRAHVDAAVLLFALAATVAAGLLFGLAPALRESSVDLNRAMKGVDSGGRTHNRLRDALAIAEIAMAFVLVVGAALMAKTFWRLTSVDAGFDPRNVLTLTTNVGSPRYQENRSAYYREMLERLRSVAGIEGVAFSSLIPMDHTDTPHVYREDRPRPSERDTPSADQFSVSTDYFQVMRIPLKSGRVFTGQDTETTFRVALINETCARMLFRSEDPIGKRIKLGEETKDGSWMTIVGVVGDVRQDGLDRAPDMQVYMALNQKAIMGFYRMLARTSGNPMALEQAVRSTFRAVDPGSPVYHVKSLEAYFSSRIADRTFALALLVTLGTLALVLAVVGIYGVISYSVAQRVREVGIRMALGAGRSEVLKMLLRHALALIGTGLVFGLGASMILAPLLADLLFAVAPNDSTIWLAVALILGLVALAAAVIPAIRAASADPMAALRGE